MRNDVKLGLAVGGVLLAVLIVYVLVVPGSQQPGAELATAEPGAETAIDSSVAAEETNQAEAVAEATSPDGNSEQTTGSTEAQGDVSAAQDEATASNAAPAGGFDWDKLLNGEAAAEIPSMSAGASIQTPHAQARATTDAPEIAAPQPAEPVAPPIAAEPSTTPDLALAQQSTPVEPTEATPTPAAPARVHIVQPNETLSSIAAAEYGSPNFYPHIQRANPSIDPTRLKPGMKINLPDVSSVKPAGSTAQKDASIDPNSQYRVQPNDSLYVISIKLYGKSDRADKIYEMNKETIGADPAKVKPGMVLKLPESPTVTASSR